MDTILCFSCATMGNARCKEIEDSRNGSDPFQCGLCNQVRYGVQYSLVNEAPSGSTGTLVYDWHLDDFLQDRLIPQKMFNVDVDTLNNEGREICDNVGLHMHSLRTCGDGSCGLHAVFGKPSAGGYLFKDGAAKFASSLLSPSLEELYSKGVSERLIVFLGEMLWNEFVKPVLENDASPEGELFWQALEAVSPALKQECMDCYSASPSRRSSIHSARNELHEASRLFFVDDLQNCLVLPLAKMLSVVPECFDPARVHESHYIAELIADYPKCCDFLESACGTDGFVKGTRELFPMIGPSCKYTALFDGRPCFDKLREAFLTLGHCKSAAFLSASRALLLSESLPTVAREALQRIQDKVEHAVTRSEETLEPPDFASRAWPAYLAFIEKQGYYFLVEELLALATIAQINLCLHQLEVH